MTLRGTAALLLATFALPLHAGDHIFTGRFEILPDNSADASRFLTQATFGPTTTDVAHLMAIGYDAWFAEQFGMPATLSEPTVEAVVNARTGGAQNVSQTQRLNRWWWQATYAPDQLRQRMAYALSQIFVVSDQASALGGDVVPLAHYQDLLATDAFGGYRTLLGDVTYSPTMGKYLNAFHNVKAKCKTVGGTTTCTTSPDENYAREIMQLFSIGLVELDLQGNPLLSGGQPIPTYLQPVITSTAKVFTGFTYSDAPLGDPNNNYNGANFFGGGANFASQSAPMACWGTELFPYDNSNMRHDITGDDNTLGSAKTILGGVQLPPSRDCADDVKDTLDTIAAHANVAPFISRQLIQRFVTSNPSPAYVGRVATVFKNSGGNLGQTLKAILMDTEARTAPDLGDTAESDSYGKLREPILRVTAMWRAFNAQAPAADAYGEIAMTGGGVSRGNYGQGPLESPTVFNFYSPDYEQPGVFADSDLASPELQIINESMLYAMTNSFYSLTHGAYVGMSSPPTDRPLIDLSALTTGGITSAQIVAKVNDAMLYGTMSASMQSTLVNTLDFGLNGASAQEKAWSVIYLTMLSPEYATQR